MKNINNNFTVVDLKASSSKVQGTILVADIANYSGMMRANESGTMELLRKFKSIVDEALDAFGGNKIKDTGDGCIILFSAAEGALSFALKCQKAFVDSSIPVRIGLHADEVLMEDGDIYGDGVNVAARIEGVAAVGGVFFSKSIYETASNNPLLETHDVGEVELKNIDTPVYLYALKNKGLNYKIGDQMETQESKFSERLHWIPRSELSKKMANAKKGAALFGTTAFLFGCKIAEDGPIFLNDETDDNIVNGINEALIQSGELSDAVSEDMNFSDAFAAARDDVGAGGFFEWNGQVYNTNTQSEFEALTDDQKEEMIDQLDEVVATHEEATDEIVDVADALQMETITINGVDALVFSDDGQVVKIEVDSDGNGTFDLTIADTTGDGQLDTMGQMTPSGTLINTEAVPEPMNHLDFMDTVAADGSLDLEILNNESATVDVDTEPIDEAQEYDIDIDPEVIVETEDLDGNGVADGYYMDEDQDGNIDAIAIDANENGIAEEVRYDTDGDGLVDEVRLDSDEDGEFDEPLAEDTADQEQSEYNIDFSDEVVMESADLDGNGVADAYLIDEDQDGIADAAALDANENGIAEEVVYDTDGDGEGDEVRYDVDEDGVFDDVQTVVEEEEEVTYDEEIYEEDIPGMTNADDMTDWQSEEEIVADASSDFDPNDAG